MALEVALKGGSESEQRKKGRKAREVKLQSPRMWHGGGGELRLCARLTSAAGVRGLGRPRPLTPHVSRGGNNRIIGQVERECM